jgi:hypothetical protein
MSNTLLALHSRYGIPLGEVLARNRRYSALLTLVCIGVLHAYAALLT